jgi:AAA+ ATPase superfamily predicted ATPase
MKLINPFSDYGTIVTHDRFVGRTKEIDAIRNRVLGASYGNISIVGLPRIGKSSLVWNAVFLDKKKLLSENVILIWVSFGEYSNLQEVFEDVRFEINEALGGNELAPELKKLEHKIIEGDTNLEKRRYLKRYFKLLKQNGLKIILALDEFDNAGSILNLQDFQFLRELSYNVETKVCLITISRKSIQELEPENGALSNFYQIFTDLRVKMFSNEDIDLYWLRVAKFGISISIEYQESIHEYCGHHPYLLDVVNHEVFNNVSQFDLNLDATFLQTVDNLRLKLFNEFEAILKLMHYECLGDKLMQMIVGPVYDINQRDIEKLLKYDLVQKKDEFENYSSFSGFFNDYLILKSSSVDVWPLWSQVEKDMRDLIKKELFESHGENWEVVFRNKFGKEITMPDGSKAKKIEVLDGSSFSLGLIAERNRSIKLFGELASNHLIDYSLPRHMFEDFISKNWPWYEKILGGQKNDWSPVFSLLGKIRNPLAHNNPEFLTDSDKNLAEGYCKKILDKIRIWKELKIQSFE